VTNPTQNRINHTKQKIHRSLNGWGERIFTVGRLFSFGFEPLDERSGGFFLCLHKYSQIALHFPVLGKEEIKPGGGLFVDFQAMKRVYRGKNART
jgi:hypothetical protein